jgi:hypothetical protein
VPPRFAAVAASRSKLRRNKHVRGAKRQLLACGFGCIACQRTDARRQAILIHMHDEPKSKLAGATIAERDHVAKFPRGIDVQQRRSIGALMCIF